MSITAYPLAWPFGWPRTTQRMRAWNKFSGNTFDKARRKLAAELERLRTHDVILSTNQPPRIDGNPYASGARVTDPGVAIYFTRTDGKQYVIARDVYEEIEANIRSLGLAIQYLRGLERHGGGDMVERAFTGFAALPDPSRIITWRDTFNWPGDRPVTKAHIEAAFRELAMIRHPDRGGSDEQMAALNTARDQALAEANL